MYVRMELGGLLTRLCGYVCDKHTDSGGVLKTRREKKEVRRIREVGDGWRPVKKKNKSKRGGKEGGKECLVLCCET